MYFSVLMLILVNTVKIVSDFLLCKYIYMTNRYTNVLYSARIVHGCSCMSTFTIIAHTERKLTHDVIYYEHPKQLDVYLHILANTTKPVVLRGKIY